MNSPISQPDPRGNGVRLMLVATLRLAITPPRPRPLAAHLRGALAQAYPELDLLHQHGTDGLIYRSPRVLYFVDGDGPVVTAIEEGAEALMKTQLVGRVLRMGAVDRTVIDSTLKVVQAEFGQTNSLLTYDFERPWLALNQKNHQQFEGMSQPERTEFLNRQLCNNCLAQAKSFGVRITQQLSAQSQLRNCTTKHKGLPMMGFTGKFSINFSIPNGMGLGKSVSKGFGRVRLTPS